MLSGPFRIELSATAEKLDPESLDQTEKKILTAGVVFDKETHNLYRFFIAPIARTPSKSASRRNNKDTSFEKVDRIYVDLRAGSKDISFLGIFPTTYVEDKGWTFDYEANASVAPLQQGQVGLKLTGTAKNLFRKSKSLITAHRTDTQVQWIYKRAWLDRGNDLRHQIFCIVAKSADKTNLGVVCSAKFADKERSLASIENRKIGFPI